MKAPFVIEVKKKTKLLRFISFKSLDFVFTRLGQFVRDREFSEIRVLKDNKIIFYYFQIF